MVMRDFKLIFFYLGYPDTTESINTKENKYHTVTKVYFHFFSIRMEYDCADIHIETKRNFDLT